jgi:Zn-dependent protease with chaperone function
MFVLIYIFIRLTWELLELAVVLMVIAVRLLAPIALAAFEGLVIAVLWILAGLGKLALKLVEWSTNRERERQAPSSAVLPPDPFAL